MLSSTICAGWEIGFATAAALTVEIIGNILTGSCYTYEILGSFAFLALAASDLYETCKSISSELNSNLS